MVDSDDDWESDQPEDNELRHESEESQEEVPETYENQPKQKRRKFEVVGILPFASGRGGGAWPGGAPWTQSGSRSSVSDIFPLPQCFL